MKEQRSAAPPEQDGAGTAASPTWSGAGRHERTGPETGALATPGRLRGAPRGVESLAGRPQLSVILRYGWRFLKLNPKYVVLFLVLSMVQMAVMVGTPLLLGQFTNEIGMAGARPSGASQTGSDRTGVELAVNPTERQVPEPGVASAPSAASGSVRLIGSYAAWAALLLGAIGLGLATKYAQAQLDVGMANAIRHRLFSSVLRQRPEFFHANDSGSLTMITNQMAVETQMTLRQMTLDPLVQCVSLTMVISAIAVSFSRLPQQRGVLPWIGMATIVLIALLSPWLVGRAGRRLQEASTGVRDQNLALASLVTGALESPEEIQAFRAEEVFSEKYERLLEAMRKARVRQTLTLEGINALTSLPGAIIQVLFAGAAVLLVVGATGQAANAGAVIAIVLLVPQLMMPVQAVSSYMVMLPNSWPSVEKVISLLESEGRGDVEPGAYKAPEAKESGLALVARGVKFRYRPDLPPVLDGVSFTVPAGRITGLVAKMGQGKTTFFRLALRFYDPQEGEILVGGVPTTKRTLDAVRSQAVMMSQFPAFFHDTVRENLRLAKPDVSDEEIEAWCRRTGIWPILVQKIGSDEERSRLPNPLDRQFAGGKTLSGGQKKLLALTRCLLRSPTHLFLDEPTVGMDNVEKYGLISELRQACTGRTVVAVDHTVGWLHQFCDYFLVLDQGRLVQEGGKELSERPGLFKELLDLEREGRTQADHAMPPPDKERLRAISAPDLRNGLQSGVPRTCKAQGGLVDTVQSTGCAQ